MIIPPKKWDIEHLQAHLQAAVELEFWTIPFYLSAMYSIKHPADHAYQLIQSVAYQEMLHVELAANLANAYGLSPSFEHLPGYHGQKIPHINFALDTPNPTERFSPFSAEIGPLDEARINAMALIEFPEWKTGHTVDLRERVEEYGSIGEFYDAVEFGAAQLVRHLQGSRCQVNFFQNYYRGFEPQMVLLDGAGGLKQAVSLIDAIRAQGEGADDWPRDIPPAFRNTADDPAPERQHFKKFMAVRKHMDEGKLPATYSGIAHPEPGSRGYQAQQILIDNFAQFRTTLGAIFRGETPEAFGAQMASLGGNILNCWKAGAIPKFYHHADHGC